MSDSDSSSSDSESEVEQKQPVQTTANDSDSDSDSSSDSEAEAPQKTEVAKADDSDSSDSDSDSDDEPEKTEVKKTPVKKDDSDSDSDSSDDSDDEKEPVKTPAKKDDDSDSDSSDSDSDDEKEPTKAPAKAAEKADDSDSDSSDSDSDDEKEAPAKADDSDDEMEETEEKKDVEMVETEKIKPTKSKGPVTILYNWDLKSSSTMSNPRKRKLENASSSQASKKKVVATSPATTSASSGDYKPTKDFNPDDFRSPQLKDKTCNVFVKGVSSNAYQEDIEKFFEELVAKPVSCRHKWEEGRSGLAWVTFATPEQASKAVIDGNNEYIKDRWVNTDWSEERKNNRNNNRGPRNAHLKGTTNRVWVGNLHREVDRDTLTELFADKGATTDVFIIGRDPTRPQIAYVSFETNDIADDVVDSFNGHQLMDNTMRLDWAEPRKNAGSGGRGSYKAQELSEKPEGCVTCFVGRLNDNVDDDKLKELFKDCGTIEGIRYMERDGEFKGVAFVSFEATEATDAAVKLNGTEFMGKNIRVDFAADRKKRDY